MGQHDEFPMTKKGKQTALPHFNDSMIIISYIVSVTHPSYNNGHYN